MESSQSHLALARAFGFQTQLTDRYKCSECGMTFQDQTTLTKHKKSKHKPKRTIICPIGKKCRRKFASASALLNHLESGSCKSGMNRGKLNQLIISHDENHHITCVNAATADDVLQKIKSMSLDTSVCSWRNEASYDPRAVLTPTSQSINESQSYPFNYPVVSSDDGDDESDGGVLLTPSTGGTFSEMSPARSLQFWPDNSLSEIDQREPLFMKAPPSQLLRCPICPPGKGYFSSVRGLQLHMDSPAHDPKIFHCPMAFVSSASGSGRLKQEKSFNTLSGLASHLEAGACRGGIETFRSAFKYIEERLLALGLNGIKLLVEPKRCCGEP
ncbi:MAG: hypothetical protein Q9167_003133 [Letrouitia subvulpina]